MGDLTGLGVGGIFVILVLKVITELITKLRGNGAQKTVASMVADLYSSHRNTAGQIVDLHEWHKPQGGKQSWMGSDELVSEIRQLRIVIESLRTEIKALKP